MTEQKQRYVDPNSGAAPQPGGFTRTADTSESEPKQAKQAKKDEQSEQEPEQQEQQQPEQQPSGRRSRE